MISMLAYYFLFRAPRNIANTSTDMYCTTLDIMKDYSTNEQKANNKYLDKVISVKGKITSLNLKEKSFVIDEKTTLLFDKSVLVKLNDSVKVKGRFLGYDELLEELKLDQCIIE